MRSRQFSSADAAAYKVDSTAPPAGAVGTAVLVHVQGGRRQRRRTSSRVDSGVIPPGLSLSDEGVLAGTPTAGGNLQLLHQGNGLDRSAVRGQVLDLDRLEADDHDELAPRSDPRGAVQHTLGLSGGTATSWTVSAGALPPGFTLSNSGVLAGTPSSEGATHVHGQGVERLEVGHEAAHPHRRRTARDLDRSDPARDRRAALRDAARRDGRRRHATPSRSPAAALPSGLTFDTASGVIDGTPRSAGNYPLQISVTASGGGAAIQTLGLVVRSKLGFATQDAPRRSRRTQLLDPDRGQGRRPAVRPHLVERLPRGLKLNGETGRLTGRAMRTGRYSHHRRRPRLVRRLGDADATCSASPAELQPQHLFEETGAPRAPVSRVSSS